MNIVIESVAVQTAMKICDCEKSIHVQPSFNIDGSVDDHLVDVVVNDVCSIKQQIDFNGLQLIIKTGHILNLKYVDYGSIKIL